MTDELNEVQILCENILKKLSAARKKIFLEGYATGYRRKISGGSFPYDQLLITTRNLSVELTKYSKDPDTVNYSDLGLQLGFFNNVLYSSPVSVFRFVGANQDFRNNATSVIVQLNLVLGKDKKKMLLKRLGNAVNKIPEAELVEGDIQKGIKIVLGLLE